MKTLEVVNAEGVALSPTSAKAWDELKVRHMKRLNEDLYCALKLGRDASVSDIKKAYRQLSLQYHPDKTRIMESSELFQVSRFFPFFDFQQRIKKVKRS